MRYKVLDSWRGIAALLVAAFHFPAGGYIHNAVLVRHAYLFVDFFFVLSGFVIAHSLRHGLTEFAGYRAFMLRRFARVYPLYASVLCAFACIEFCKLAAASLLHVSPQTAPFAPGSYADPALLWQHLTLMQIFGLSRDLSWNWPDWSIAAEMWTYAVFGLTCLVAAAYRRAVLCALCAMAFVVLFEWSNRGIAVTYDLGFVRCLYSFTAGALVCDLWKRVSFTVTGVLATACEILAVAVALFFVLASGQNASSFAAPAVFGLLIFVFAFQGGSISRVLAGDTFQLLGTLSYAIYIVHALVVMIVTLVASMLLGGSLQGAWRTQSYDGITERILNIADPLLPDMLTLGYLAIVVLLAFAARHLIEEPARAAIGRWAKGYTVSRPVGA